MDGNFRVDDAAEIADALRAMGLLGAGENLLLSSLGGGVSCDVWRAALGECVVCVKRALPRLRVEAEWLAPAERAASEVEWLHLVATIEPQWVPRVLGEDRRRHLFVMGYLPPDVYPIWKSELARGTVDLSFAAEVGDAIARIHGATAGRADIAAQFANDVQFHALRIEPYLLYTADKHPDVADSIRKMAEGIAESRIALTHGDVSPKNILCGPHGPVFLDAETTCYGDPAFDLAFCLNHLLLKCIWHPQWTEPYLDAFAALKSSYLAGAHWEDPAVLERRATRLLPALLLARIDGKSPVEYLVEEDDKKIVREQALALLREKLPNLHDVARRWADVVRRKHR